MGRRRWSARLERSEQRRRPQRRRAGTRATELSDRYLGGLAGPDSVRWVDNQTARWGSCTPGDRTIRLSARLQGMPAWVIDYVLVHELAHLLEPGHDAVLGAGWTATRRPSGPRATCRAGRRRGARSTSRRRDVTSASPASAERCPAHARQPRSARACPARGRAASSTGHQRTSSDSSLTAGSAPRRRTAPGSGRRGGAPSPRGSQKVTACSSRCTGTGSSASPAQPGLLGGLPQRGAGQGGVPGLAVTAELRTSGAPCGAG